MKANINKTGFDRFFDEQMKNEEFRKGYEKARREIEKEIHQREIYPGFWAVMPRKTRIAFVSFLIAKFLWAPLSLVMMFVSNDLAKYTLILYGLSLIISVYYTISEMCSCGQYE